MYKIKEIFFNFPYLVLGRDWVVVVLNSFVDGTLLDGYGTLLLDIIAYVSSFHYSPCHSIQFTFSSGFLF
jgi:hypothetical protein